MGAFAYLGSVVVPRAAVNIRVNLSRLDRVRCVLGESDWLCVGWTGLAMCWMDRAGCVGWTGLAVVYRPGWAVCLIDWVGCWMTGSWMNRVVLCVGRTCWLCVG